MFFAKPELAKPDDFFKALNNWIPNSPEVFVDVADYKHVSDGPITLLYGHYCDFVLDDTDHKRGFAYAYKRVMNGSDEEKIATTLKAFLNGCVRLEKEADYNKEAGLLTNKIEFIINDRALAPNTAETFDALAPVLNKVLAKVYGKDGYSLTHLAENPKKRFGILIEAKTSAPVAELAQKI